MSSAGETETIVALGTARGVAAIAVIRVTGPGSARLAQDIFGATELRPRQMMRGDYRNRRGEVLDDVLWTFFAGPRSYTGEDTLEISCHGSVVLAQLVIEDLVARGSRPAEAGEFTRRAFLNGQLDLSQAEAVMDLIHARSERALAVANQQLRGALGRRMGELIEGLLSALARVEAYIDFPDEDLPAEDRTRLRADLETVARGARQLLASSRFGELLRDGIKTVILGEPNAGKSSLLNRLVGRDRAIVSPEPGTTRDFLEEAIGIGPHWLRLIDTAGLNAAPGEIERLGIARTLDQAQTADLVLWVVDGSAPSPAPLPAEIATRLTPANTVIVVNKIDLVRAGRGNGDASDHRRVGLLPHPVVELVGVRWPTEARPVVVGISALTGEGLDELTATVVARADALQPETGAELIAVNARHAEALRRVGAALQGALSKLAEQAPVELLASDLREALEACGSIAGRVDNERMLDHLFASFCIGK